MKEKHFLQLQGVRSVDRVSNECLSAQAFDGFDFWLDEEFVQRVHWRGPSDGSAAQRHQRELCAARDIAQHRSQRRRRFE